VRKQTEKTCPEVDLATVTAEQLHNRLVLFGVKHVGDTYQEAMQDQSYMLWVIKWMTPRCTESRIFHRYIELVLQPHMDPPAAVADGPDDSQMETQPPN